MSYTLPTMDDGRVITQADYRPDPQQLANLEEEEQLQPVEDEPTYEIEDVTPSAEVATTIKTPVIEQAQNKGSEL